MPKQIQAPDGGIIEFPDDMSDDDIANVMRQQFPTPQQPPPVAAEPGTPPVASPPSAAEIGGGGSAPPQAPSPPLTAWGVAGDVSQGLLGNYADELAAGVQSLKTGRPYSELQPEIQAKLEEHQKVHPGVSLAGQLTGAVAQGMLGGKLAQAALPESLLTSKLVNPITGGILGGGIAGSGTGEGFVDRAKRGMAGSLLGGIVGTGATVLGAVGSGLKRMLTTPSAKTTGLEMIDTALKRDRTNITDAISKVTSSRDPINLLDIGPSSQRLGRTIQTIPSQGSRDVEEALTQRQSESGGRIVDLIQNTIDPRSAKSTVENLISARDAAVRPAYEKAYAHGPVHDDFIAGLLKNPNVKEGINRGIRTERNLADAAGRPMDIADYAITGFNEAGDPIIGKVPNMRLLDTAKRGLDDMLEGYRDKTTGRLVLDAHGRSIDKLRRSLVSHLDDLNPDYKAARLEFEGPTRSKNAVQAGKDFMSGDLDSMETKFDDLSPSDRDFFVLGMARQMRDMAKHGSSDTVDATRKLLSGKSKERLEQFLGPDQYDELLQGLGVERNMTRTFRTATTGSPTGRIGAEQADAARAGQKALSFAADLAAWGAPTALANTVRRNLGKGEWSGLQEGTADWLAPRVLTRDPAELNRLAMQLRQYLNRREGAKMMGAALGSGAAATGVDFVDRGR